jgi:hypothetical protein
MLTNETVPSDKIIQISNAKELIMQNLVSANQVIWVWTGNGKELYMLCCHVAQKSFTSFTEELKMKVCEWEFTWSSSRDDYRSWKFQCLWDCIVAQLYALWHFATLFTWMMSHLWSGFIKLRIGNRVWILYGSWMFPMSDVGGREEVIVEERHCHVRMAI